MLTLPLILLVSATLSSALPASIRWRYSLAKVPDGSPGPWCQGLGGGAFDTAFNFTLTAYNATLPNANLTGAPLVIGQAGAIAGAQFKVLSTYASYPFNQWPTLSLISGGLKPDNVSASGRNVTEGSEPGFIFTSKDLPPPEQIYCAIAPTTAHGSEPGFPQLAVHRDARNFHLCSKGNQSNAQVNVVYKPTPDNSGAYNFESCYPVTLFLAGLGD